MCELYAVSSAVAKRISFSLCEFRRHGGDTGDHCDGWGIAFFYAGELEVHRETGPAALSLKMDHVLQHHKPSDIVISHIRKATQGSVSLQNTQPYSMEIKGVDHVFVHNGDLADVQNNVPIARYKPKGETDSEHAFCYLMEKLEPLLLHDSVELEQKISVIKEVFNRLSTLGPANFIYSDGEHLFAFANKRTQVDGELKPPGLYYLIRDADNDRGEPRIAGMELTGFRQDQILLASVPLSDENWQAFERNQLIVVRFGKILYSSH